MYFNIWMCVLESDKEMQRQHQRTIFVTLSYVHVQSGTRTLSGQLLFRETVLFRKLKMYQFHRKYTVAEIHVHEYSHGFIQGGAQEGVCPPSNVNAPPYRLTIFKHVYRHVGKYRIIFTSPPPKCFVSSRLPPLAKFLNETMTVFFIDRDVSILGGP